MKTVTNCIYELVDGVVCLTSVDTDQGPVVFDRADTFPSSENWTHWPVLKAKYDLEMPGEPTASPSSPSTPPSGGGDGSQNTPLPDPGL